MSVFAPFYFGDAAKNETALILISNTRIANFTITADICVTAPTNASLY